MDKTSVSSEAALEPGVIAQNILISLAIDQGPKKEAGRLFLQHGIELDKLKEIRIEFLSKTMFRSSVPVLKIYGLCYVY